MHPSAHGKDKLLPFTAPVLAERRKARGGIGLHGRYVCATRQAGNPHVMPGVNIVIGRRTEIISAKGVIAAAGRTDSRIHCVCPQRIVDAPRR